MAETQELSKKHKLLVKANTTYNIFSEDFFQKILFELGDAPINYFGITKYKTQGGLCELIFQLIGEATKINDSLEEGLKVEKTLLVKSIFYKMLEELPECRDICKTFITNGITLTEEEYNVLFSDTFATSIIIFASEIIKQKGNE